MSWGAFCDWVAGKTVEDEVPKVGSVLLRFTDGTRAEMISKYDGPYSDITPGEGVMPPTVRVAEADPSAKAGA